MMTITFLPLFLIGCAFAVLIVLILAVVWLLSRWASSRSLSDEESKMVLELWTGLQKMESRMANLETIFLDRSRERKP